MLGNETPPIKMKARPLPSRAQRSHPAQPAPAVRSALPRAYGRNTVTLCMLVIRDHWSLLLLGPQSLLPMKRKRRPSTLQARHQGDAGVLPNSGKPCASDTDVSVPPFFTGTQCCGLDVQFQTAARPTSGHLLENLPLVAMLVFLPSRAVASIVAILPMLSLPVNIYWVPQQRRAALLMLEGLRYIKF